MYSLPFNFIYIVFAQAKILSSLTETQSLTFKGATAAEKKSLYKSEEPWAGPGDGNTSYMQRR